MRNKTIIRNNLLTIQLLLGLFHLFDCTSCGKGSKQQTQKRSLNRAVEEFQKTSSDSIPKATEPPPSGKPSKVKLIDKGKEPYKELRYTYKANSQHKIQVTIRHSMSVIKDNHKLPVQNSQPIHFSMNASIKTVDKHGLAILHLVFDYSPSSESFSGLETVMFASVLKALNGVTAIQSIDALGVVKDTMFQIPAKSPQNLESVWLGTQRLVQNFIPFPREPIGLGAQWEVRQEIPLTTMTRQTTTYKLVKLNGSNGTIKIRVEQEGQPGSISALSNQDIETYLEFMNAKGNAQFEFDLNSGLNWGKATMVTDLQHVAESAVKDSVTRFHTVQEVEKAPYLLPKKRKKEKKAKASSPHRSLNTRM